MWLVLTDVETKDSVRVNMDTIGGYGRATSPEDKEYTYLSKIASDTEWRVVETPDEIDYLMLTGREVTDIRGFWETRACNFLYSYYEADDTPNVSVLHDRIHQRMLDRDLSVVKR